MGFVFPCASNVPRWMLLAVLLLALARGALAADEARIVVRKFRVVGNTLLSQKTIKKALDPFVNRPLALRDIKAAARTLRGLYRQRGYLMAYAYVPPQDFLDDTVELRVQQGKYGKVSVDGNRYYSDDFILHYFQPARSEGYVLARKMEHALLVLNQFTDLKVQSVLEARKDGTVAVTLKTKDQWPVHATLDFDNFGAVVVGKNRAGASVTAGSTITEGDLLALKVTYPFEVSGAQPFVFATYGVPIGYQGARLEASFAHATTIVGGALAQAGIQGEAKIGTLRLNVNDRLDLRHADVWFYEIVAKDVKNTGLNRAVAISDDEIREVGIGHRGSASSKDGKAYAAHSYELLGGLGQLLGGSAHGSSTSRPGADDGFARVTLDALVTYKVITDGFVLLRLSGQMATGPLVVAEQFAVGGPDSVRAYQQGEFLGDDGYAVTAEYRHTVRQKAHSNVQALLFADHGGASLKKPSANETARKDLTAAGVGLRGTYGSGFTVRLDMGFCVDPTFNIDHEKSRLNAQASYRF